MWLQPGTRGDTHGAFRRWKGKSCGCILILALQCFLASDAAQCVPTPQEQDLIGRWLLNGNLLDSSGNGRNAAVASGNPTFVADGLSMNFGGVLRVPGLANFAWSSLTGFTVSIFYRRSGNNGNYAGIINNGYYSSSSFEIRMGREQGARRIFGSVNTGGLDGLGGGDPPLAQWHHVAMTWVRNGQASWYLNGASNSRTTSGALSQVGNPVYMAGHPGEPYNGRLADARLYSRALSAAEIQELATYKDILNAGTSGLPFCPTVPAPAPIAHPAPAASKSSIGGAAAAVSFSFPEGDNRPNVTVALTPEGYLAVEATNGVYMDGIDLLAELGALKGEALDSSGPRPSAQQSSHAHLVISPGASVRWASNGVSPALDLLISEADEALVFTGNLVVDGWDLKASIEALGGPLTDSVFVAVTHQPGIQFDGMSAAFQFGDGGVELSRAGEVDVSLNTKLFINGVDVAATLSSMFA